MRFSVTTAGIVLGAALVAAFPLDEGHQHHKHAVKREVVTVYVTTQVQGVDTVAVEGGSNTQQPDESLSDTAADEVFVSTAPAQDTAPSSAAASSSAGGNGPAPSSFSTAYGSSSGGSQAASSSSGAFASESSSSGTAASGSSSSSGTSSGSASPSSSSGSASGVPETISYSPYQNDGSCKDASSIKSDLATVAGKGIKSLRIYGTDCDSISNVCGAAKSLGLTINQGFYITSGGADSIDDGVQSLVSWVRNSNNNDWSLFTAITVGNEAVFNNFVSGSELLSKIKSVKSTLKSAGYTGPITTAETSSSYSSYPDLCTDTDGVDFVSLNAHPYFDTSASADTAGDFILSQISSLQSTCNGRDVYISETGYPSAGNSNGGNVPSVSNQKVAISKLMSALKGKGAFFTCFNDQWKQPGPFNVEQHFGILDLF